MKVKSTPSTVKDRGMIKTENDRRQKAGRRIGLRLAAIFLIIVFLASECAPLLSE